MGAVRSFTPTAYILNDDDLFAVDLGFTFWGYTRAHVSNNGSVSFHANYVDNRTDGNFNSRAWDDLGWEYCWGMPLDPTAPFTEDEKFIYWYPWTAWVTLAPLATDIPRASNDEAELHQVYYGFDTIGGKQAFLVTWENVIQYDLSFGSPDPVNIPRNTFQVVIYDDDTWEFNYDKVEWTHPYSWDTINPPDLGLTETQWSVVNALGGYRMLPHANYEVFTLAYTNATGTLSVGDTLSWSYDAEHGEVLSMTGDSTTGEVTVRLLAQTGLWESMPPGFSYERLDSDYPNIQYQNDLTITGSGGWSVLGADTTMTTSLLTADDHVTEEFDWSRTISYIDVDTYDPYQQFLDIVDSGADPISLRSNCGVPGRFVSTASLNFVPNMVVDVTLEATLSSSLPQAGGSLDVAVVLPDTFLGIDTIYSDGQIDIDVDLPSAALSFAIAASGSMSVPVDATATVTYGGTDLPATGEIDSPVDVSGSWYFDKTWNDLNYDIGGFWNPNGAYGPDSSATWQTMSQTYVANVFSTGFAAYRYTHAANTNGSKTWLYNYMLTGSNQFYGGLTYQYMVDVYVPAGSPAFKLVAYGPKMDDYQWGPTYIYGPYTEIASAATTVTNAWQTITVTIPATNDLNDDGWTLFAHTVDQTVPGDFYLKNGRWRAYGPMVDTGWYTSEPSFYGPMIYNQRPGILYTDVIGLYDNISGSPSSTFGIDTFTRSGSGYSWRFESNVTGNLVNKTQRAVTWEWGTQRQDGGKIRFGAWVYVPSGYPRVRVGAIVSMIRQTAPYEQTKTDVAVPAYSTKWDEWEYVEAEISHMWRYQPGTGLTSAGDPRYGNSPRPYIAPDTFEGQSVFYVDDVFIRPLPISVTEPMPIYANAVVPYMPQHKTSTEAVVDVAGTLENLTKMVAGSVDIDIDMETFVPYEEPVSGSINTGVSTVLGQSGRYYAFARPGTLTSWDWFGFEGNVYRYENEGDYWWDEQFFKEGDTDSYPWYRLGGWTPPTGGAQDSQVCLMYVMPAWYPTTPGGEVTSYHAAYVDMPMGKKLFGLRVCVWVYNTDPNVPLTVKFANDSAWLPDYSDFAQIFGTAQTTKTGEWEMMVCDIPADTIWQNSNRNGITALHYVTVVVYGSDPRRRHTFYVDNLDYYWYLDDSSATTSIASI